MGAGGLEADAGQKLDLAGDLQILQPQRTGPVQPFDQVDDVGLGILRQHPARDRLVQLAPVDDDGGVRREHIVRAGMVDVQLPVQDAAHIAHPDAVFLKLPLDHVLVELRASHPQQDHDRIVAVAGIDEDRILSAEDQKPQSGTRRVRPQSRPSTSNELSSSMSP